MPHHLKPQRAIVLGCTFAITASLALTVGPPSVNATVPPPSNYKISMGPISGIPNGLATDTPAGSYVDKDGTYYAQGSGALYSPSEPRYWKFFSGTDFNNSTLNTGISSATNPADPADSNSDTTKRCNTSPTGREATPNPATPSDQLNYCDLVGVWVDPDTGDWYGLVHNEFTMSPFGNGMHYDSIDYAVSKDQGKTWVIKDHVLTSPYSTTRNDTSAFPGKNYDYGDGDPRLYVDAASGYFYVYYNSRALPKGGGDIQANFSHVARAPMSSKMDPASWTKWYDGSWSQPGHGGKESNIVPVDSENPNGFTPTNQDYNPTTPGTNEEQIAAGTMPHSSDLNTMNIIYNAYLGLYIGQPEVRDQNTGAPQRYYATDNLATQKWKLIGDSGGFITSSWYRWMLDAKNLTNPYITGKDFQSYFLYGSHQSGQSTVTIAQNQAPQQPVNPGKSYRISAGSNRVLTGIANSENTTSVAGTGSTLESWNFIYDASQGTYKVINAQTGKALSAPSEAPAARAWGTAPVTANCNCDGTSQQWFLIQNTDPATGNFTGSFRLINRYSGLALALSDVNGRLAETTPARAWTNTTGNPVGGTRTAAEQTLSLTETGPSTPLDLALGKPTTASSSQGVGLSADQATDGNVASRWSSAASDPQWLQVDLGSVSSIRKVRLNWEAAYARAYQIQTSNDGTTWNTIYSTTTGAGGVEVLNGLNGSGRYIRMNGLSRGTGYGYSLWDFEVYAQ